MELIARIGGSNNRRILFLPASLITCPTLTYHYMKPARYFPVSFDDQQVPASGRPAQVQAFYMLTAGLAGEIDTGHFPPLRIDQLYSHVTTAGQKVFDDDLSFFIRGYLGERGPVIRVGSRGFRLVRDGRNGVFDIGLPPGRRIIMRGRLFASSKIGVGVGNRIGR